MSSFYFASGMRSTQHKDYDAIPNGSNFTEFYSRPVEGSLLHSKSDGEITRLNSNDDEDNSFPLQKVAPQVPGLDPPIGSLILKRKVPLKADPKAMLSAERTFMQWMHTSLWLLSASLTMMRFAGDDPIKFIYGALIIPVALTFTLYSLYQFRKRVFMLRHKLPGPYEDIKGPIILTLMLMSSIVAQFLARLIYYVV